MGKKRKGKGEDGRRRQKKTAQRGKERRKKQATIV